MANTNIDRFRVVGTNIVESMTGKILYSSDSSNLEIQSHCDILNGRKEPYWVNEEHLIWVPNTLGKTNKNNKF